MRRLTRKLVASGVLGVVAMLVTAGVADARIALNHSETLLRDGS